MTKNELVILASERANVEKQLVEKVLNALLNESKEAIVSGKSVFIRGFGTLEPVTRRAKIGQDIRRQMNITIPARTEPRFRPCPSFKQEVRSGASIKGNEF